MHVCQYAGLVFCLPQFAPGYCNFFEKCVSVCVSVSPTMWAKDFIVKCECSVNHIVKLQTDKPYSEEYSSCQFLATSLFNKDEQLFQVWENHQLWPCILPKLCILLYRKGCVPFTCKGKLVALLKQFHKKAPSQTIEQLKRWFWGLFVA